MIVRSNAFRTRLCAVDVVIHIKDGVVQAARLSHDGDRAVPACMCNLYPLLI